MELYGNLQIPLKANFRYIKTANWLLFVIFCWSYISCTQVYIVHVFPGPPPGEKDKGWAGFGEEYWVILYPDWRQNNFFGPNMRLIPLIWSILDQNNAYRTQILHPSTPPVIKYLDQIGDLPPLFGALLTKTTYISRGRILGPGPAAGEKYWVSVHYIHLWSQHYLSVVKPGSTRNFGLVYFSSPILGKSKYHWGTSQIISSLATMNNFAQLQVPCAKKHSSNYLDLLSPQLH